MSSYIIKKITLIVLIISAINWGLMGLFEFNLIKYITNNNFSRNHNIKKIIYIIVGISGLLGLKYFLNRDTMLPFLGKTVYPCKAVSMRYPDNYNKSIVVNVKPNSNVIYWAANEKNNTNSDCACSYKEAYKNYKNSGVTRSNKIGKAILRFKYPQSYSVPYRGKLKPHVHYRVCEKNGMLSRIETVYL